MKNRRSLKLVDQKTWLDLFGDHSVKFSLNTCRYDCRNFDWVLKRYQMEEHLLIWVEQGYLGVRLEGEKVKVTPGTMIWIPPGGIRTLWGKKTSASLHHYKIRFNLHKGVNEYTFTKHNLVKQHAWAVLPYLKLLVEESNKQKAYYAYTIKSLLCSLSTTFFNIPNQETDHGSTLNNIQRIKLERFIDINIQAGIQPRDLSDHLGLTLDYVSRIFKTTYGLSPQAYIKHKRIHYAAECLLDSTITVKELAYELSYSNVNLFCRQFKDIMKLTPSQYRETNSFVSGI